jgi:hypothetical protein
LALSQQVPDGLDAFLFIHIVGIVFRVSHNTIKFLS